MAKHNSSRHKRSGRAPRGAPEDLSPYEGCRVDTAIGMTPLAVGWLQAGRPFVTGATPADFGEALLAFCLSPHTVCPTTQPLRCPLCRQVVVLPGQQGAEESMAEIRVIGETEIYAAPTLIYHYLVAHDYQPPDEFVTAVLEGPPAGSATHRALIRALQSLA